MPQWGDSSHSKLKDSLGNSKLWGFPWFYRCVCSLDYSTLDAVSLLPAISVSLDPTHPQQGESRLHLPMTQPGFTICGACFLVDLLALLKWKAFPDRIMDILGRLRHVSGEEIVKVWLSLNSHMLAEQGIWAEGLTSPWFLPISLWDHFLRYIVKWVEIKFFFFFKLASFFKVGITSGLLPFRNYI